MRSVALVAVALLVAATLVAPTPDRPVPLAPDPQTPAPYTVCPLVEAAQRNAALTFVGGGAEEDTSISIFSAGEFVVEETLTLSDTGTGALDMTEVTGLARAPVLISLGDPAAAVETVITGGGVAAAPCTSGSPDPQGLLGGSTAEGHTYTVLLANPFAGSATVDVLAASEVGSESDPSLSGVVVPPRSIVAVDVHSLLPSRQGISAVVATNQGRVAVGAIHSNGSDISATGGVTPAMDWFLPVPELEGASASLVLFAPDTVEVPFQIDVYGSDGVFEGAYEDVVPPRGQTVVPVGELLEGPGALRVVSAAPVLASLRLSGEAGNALVPGTSQPALSWRLPGAGRLGDSTVQIFNPGAMDVTAQLQAGTGSEIESVEVPAGVVVELPLGSRGVGGRLEADGEVVVSWTTVSEGGLAADTGSSSGG